MRTRYWPLAALLVATVIASPVLASKGSDGEPVPPTTPDARLLAVLDRAEVGQSPSLGGSPERPGVQPEPGAGTSGPRSRPSRPVVRLPANPPRVVALNEQPLVPSVRGGSVSGTASYYCSPAHPICHYRYPVGSMVAAACGRLRNAIGPKWRGRFVTVTAGSRAVRVQLVDWCGSSSKTIDLYAAPFQRLAPLSRGVVKVTVSWQ